MWLVHRKGVFVHRRLAVFGNSRGRSSSVFGLYFDHKELLLPVVIRTVFSRHRKGGAIPRLLGANEASQPFDSEVSCAWLDNTLHTVRLLLSSRRAARVKTFTA